MMRNKEQVVQGILKEVEEFGLVEVLHRVFGKNIRIRLELSKATCKMPIEEMTLSVRAYNALKRTGIDSIGELADWLNENKLGSVRNLGAKSLREIQTKILVLGYEGLGKKDRCFFVADLIERNFT